MTFRTPRSKPNAGARRADARFGRIVLHIGTEKTGTSALQLYLERHRKALSRASVAYPPSPTATSQWQFVAAVHEAPWTDDDFAREFEVRDAEAQERLRADLRDQVAALAARHPGGTLIVSSEHFHSRISSGDEVRRLRDLLAPHTADFEIVVYFRRQDEAAVSLRSTFVKSGNNLAADTLTLAPPEALPLFHYDDLYERWAGVFGAEAMRPRLYAWASAHQGGIVGDFFEASGLPLPAPPQPRDGGPANPSLSREGYLFLREANAHLKGQGAEADALRRNLAERVSRLMPGKFHPFGAPQARAFTDRFADRNERLRQLAFPDEPAPLFGTDYGGLPEAPDAQEATPADIAAAAIRLLRAEPDMTPAKRLGRLVRRRGRDAP